MVERLHLRPNLKAPSAEPADKSTAGRDSLGISFEREVSLRQTIRTRDRIADRNQGMNRPYGETFPFQRIENVCAQRPTRVQGDATRCLRLEERRGGEEGRFRWVADH